MLTIPVFREPIANVAVGLAGLGALVLLIDAALDFQTISVEPFYKEDEIYERHLDEIGWYDDDSPAGKSAIEVMAYADTLAALKDGLLG